jgi:hypothetical protein
MTRILNLLLLFAAQPVLVNSASATQTTCGRIKQTADGFAALRDGPSVTANLLLKLNVGELLDLQHPPGEWEIVEYVHSLKERGPRRGYVHPSLVEAVPPALCDLE